jgi:anti-sigma-K factor RskA
VTTMAEVHTLSGAYALDALDAEEAAVFREHLSGCAACTQEVRELREAAARMGAVEAVPPPPDLRARVLAAVDRTPQLPPVPRAEEPSVVTPLAGPDHEGGRTRGRRWGRLALAAAAAVVVGGGAIGIGQAVGGSDSERLSAAEQVFKAEDARTLDERTMNGGELLVAVSPERGEMAVDTAKLPALEGGKVYQLWTLGADDTAVSVGVIEAPGETAAMDMPPKGTKVALTIEPAGGSEQPTKAPIVEVEPAAV